MDDRDRGTDGRGTRDRGTGRRGVADAGASSGRRPDRPDGGVDAGSRQANLPEIGLLVYQVAKEGAGAYVRATAEAQNLCEQPKRGLWQRTRFVGSVASLVGTVQEFATQFRIVRLGILAHGDAGGRITIGGDTIEPATFETFRGSISQLQNSLAPNADVFIYGCISAVSKAGSALLKEISVVLPGRRIIGFTVVNIVKKPFGSSEVRKEEGRPCVDPEIWCTNVRESQSAFRYMNEATDTAPQAKIAKDGKIIQFPSFVDFQTQIFPENPKSDDSTLKELTAPSGGSKRTNKR